MGEQAEIGPRSWSRLALVAAALLQAAVALVVAVVLLLELRDIIRDPGRWKWLSFVIWMILGAPIVGWAGLTLVWTPGLMRGQHIEWRRALAIWSVVGVVGVVQLLFDVPFGLGPRALCWVALAIVALLLLGRRARR